MLVYGDHHFEAGGHILVAGLRRMTLRAARCPNDVEALRCLLIACGQFEQGVHDALAGQKTQPLIDRVHRATGCAAEAFYSRAWQQPEQLPAPIVATQAALRELLGLLDELSAAPDCVLAVKAPEGFGLYALFPEQYLVAAGRWLNDHDALRSHGAVVAGIRTIGTTLAALVAAVLRAGGWRVHSFTVRPQGHPYDRRVALCDARIEPGALGLVVDEGPGISGSSMAAVAAALVAAGLAREQIAFLPGHLNDPGGAGAPDVQQWWRTTRRYAAATGDIWIDGCALRESLARMLPDSVVEIEDFGYGLWRKAVYPRAGLWPAVCTGFERVKHRYTLEDGRRVLVKFLGLASLTPNLASTAARAAALLHDRSSRMDAPRVIGTAHGFVATEWVEGVPASRRSLSAAAIDTIGAYSAAVAGDVIDVRDARSAHDRLCEMLVTNTTEALGERAAEGALRLCVSGSDLQRSYGDGHLHPHEWIDRSGKLTGAGALCKVDGVGHECDHTLIGRQPVAWEIAGALVEWRMGDAAASRLLNAFGAAGGETITTETLDFYKAAYLAFRTGQCTLAAQVHDPLERGRLVRAAANYRSQLAHCLTRQGLTRQGEVTRATSV